MKSRQFLFVIETLGLLLITISTSSFLLLLYRPDDYQTFINHYLSSAWKQEFETQYPWQWIFPFGASALTTAGSASGLGIWFVAQKLLSKSSTYLAANTYSGISKLYGIFALFTLASGVLLDIYIARLTLALVSLSFLGGSYKSFALKEDINAFYISIGFFFLLLIGHLLLLTYIFMFYKRSIAKIN